MFWQGCRAGGLHAKVLTRHAIDPSLNNYAVGMCVGTGIEWFQCDRTYGGMVGDSTRTMCSAVVVVAAIMTLPLAMLRSAGPAAVRIAVCEKGQGGSFSGF